MCVDANVVTDGGQRKAVMKLHISGRCHPRYIFGAEGNKVVTASCDSFIESESTGERIPLRVERGRFVFGVVYTNRTPGTITFDSGAGVNVWPEHLLLEVPMVLPEAGLAMTAADGTDIPSKGMKFVKVVGGLGSER
jgi:hypothetical protein